MRSGYITSEEMRWLLVDFDETICRNEGAPDFKPTTIIEGAKEALDKLVSNHWKIIIYTSRHWGEHQIIEDWLNEHRVPFKQIICGKPLARWIIDDRAISFKGNWQDVLDKVK